MEPLGRLASEAAKLVTCGICRSALQDPVRTHPCEHTFCKLCLQLDVQFAVHTICPTCLVPLESPYFSLCCPVVSKVTLAVSKLTNTIHATAKQLKREGVEAQEGSSREKLLLEEGASWVKVIAKRNNSNHSTKGERERPMGHQDVHKRLTQDASHAYGNAQFQHALNLYTKAIKYADKTNVETIFSNRSACFLMLHQPKACLSDISQLSEEAKKSTKILKRTMKCYVAMGDLAKAYHVHPADETVATALPELQEAMQFQEVNQWASALGKWQKLHALFPDTIPFLCQLCTAYYKTDDSEKAQAALAEAVQRNSLLASDSLVLHELARSCYFQGFEYFRLAQKYIERCGEVHPEATQLRATMKRLDHLKATGNEAFQRHDWSTAVEHYSEAMEVDPSNMRTMKILLCNRAAAYKELGNARGGVDDCSRVIAMDALFTKAYVRRARCYLILEDYENAHKDFMAAHKLDPEDRDISAESKNCEIKMQREANRDYYELLGVSRTTFSEKELKQKYRELSLRWHPDKCVSFSEEERTVAERKFKLISEAYSVLSDMQKRREYDLKLERTRLRSAFHADNLFHSTNGSGDTYSSKYNASSHHPYPTNTHLHTYNHNAAPPPPSGREMRSKPTFYSHGSGSTSSSSAPTVGAAGGVGGGGGSKGLASGTGSAATADPFDTMGNAFAHAAHVRTTYL